MKTARKWMLSVIVFAGVLLILSACGSQQTESKQTGSSSTLASTSDMSSSIMMNKGETAPEFSLLDLKGNTVGLSDVQGKKVYVKYWASWCSICLAGLEDLNNLAGQNNDFQVITIVTPDYKGEKSSQAFTEWFDQQPYDNITVLLDEKGVWAKKFGVRAYPSSFYIGSDGILAKSQPGHASNEQIMESLQEIL
ncbi:MULTISPECIES: redoxin family protein [unclassified Paenibacillus]|uniref:redoxin family protein n=1 Tax=unclassified Paenibacillus TaxID=185978 RepID=UPI000CFB356F|nr:MULTISPECIES: redoxin family protein [unclassified Paenibacillus]MBD8837795.1 redoxin domain-containing protein [Paenibacillus sp. CFBP 13594]PRA09547.1 thioredoxin [Paenibacillus sp. MYb63]PRA46302.1 thioredoxin [Paenibacillus sp. MYb67]QZN73775.1 redoxin family protein [Paenibacillus sp. DR312]